MATAKQVLTDNLKCPICQDVLNRPKVLPCSHTFCEECLVQLHRTQAMGGTVQCAVCRETSAVVDSNVTNFPTNQIVHALAEDFKTRSEKRASLDTPDGGCSSSQQACTTCGDDDDNDGLMAASVYCQNCSEFLCDRCLQQHNKFKPNSSHEFIGVEDITSGKIKRKRACPEHPKELQHFVCINCLVCICCRCLEVSHEPEDHEIIDISEFEESYNAEVKHLQEKASRKVEDIEEYSSYVRGNICNVKDILAKQKRKIENAYEVARTRLSSRKEELLDECNKYEETLCKQLENTAECNDVFLGAILDKVSVINDGVNALPEDQPLSTRAAHCKELDDMLSRDQRDHSIPESMASRAQDLTFHPCDSPNDLELGRVYISNWQFRREVTLEAARGVAFMTATPDGEMAVGSKNGDMRFFSADGQLKRTMTGMGFRGIGFLSDGRCVTRAADNGVSMYTLQWDKLDVVFHTMGKDEGGVGSLTVNTDDDIFVDYRKARKIQMFSPEGGEPVRAIPCDGYDPWQIFTMATGGGLLTLSHSNSARIIDYAGVKKHVITKDVTVHIHPAVCQDGTILLACLNQIEGVLDIERYTSEMAYMETLIVHHKIEITDRKWYHLQEFKDGEIALCTPDKLYIFGKKS